MGYDFHITRAQNWCEIGEGEAIRAEEWLKYVENDPELKLAGYNGAYFALWSGKSGSAESWFDWSDGEVNTKNPDPAVIAKAIKIAADLGARVQGDEGEIYQPDGTIERDGEVITGLDWRTRK